MAESSESTAEEGLVKNRMGATFGKGEAAGRQERRHMQAVSQSSASSTAATTRVTPNPGRFLTAV